MVDQSVPTAEIIWAWPHLSSQKVTIYQTCLHLDGQLSCNCLGWTRVKKDKPRGCTHTKNTPADEIQERLRKHKAGIPMTDRIVLSLPGPTIRQSRTAPELPTGGRLYQAVDEEDE